MKRLALLMMGLVLPLAGGCTQPDDLYQRANVTMDDDRLCVSVSRDSGSDSTTTRLAGLTLSRIVGDGTEAIWELDFTGAPQPVFLAPDDCLGPGMRWGGGVTESITDLPTAPGTYTLSIMGAVPANEPEGDGWVARLYRENFCVVKRSSGAVSIVHVPWGKGRPRWDVCGQ